MEYSFDSFINRDFDWNPETRTHTGLHLRAMDMDITGGKISRADIDVLANHPEADTVTISGLNQDTFEYFLQTYGQQLKAIRFFKNKLVEDWSMLGSLPELEYIHFFSNQRIDSFWDMTNNTKLTGLSVSDFTRIKNVERVSTAPALEDFRIGNAIWPTMVVESLLPLAGTRIKHLSFSGKDIMDKDLSFLSAMPDLETYDFPTNLYTTEQVAWIAANHPGLSGFAITPYTGYPASENNETSAGWVVGKRKPYLPYKGNEARIRKYALAFEALKEKYRGVPYASAFHNP